MKEKFIIFIIGLLLGAVISTGAFYVYTTTNSSNGGAPNTQMNGGTPPSMPSGGNSDSNTPPEMPSNDNSTSSQENNS